MVLLVLFLFLLINSNPVSAERCFNESGFFKPNDTYDINRKAILSSLPSNVTNNNNFYTTSLGQDPNKSYGLGMCLPGSKTQDCSDCIVAASNSLLQNCPNQIEAVNWRLGNTLCLVRYSNNSFNGLLNKEMVWAEFNTRDFQVNLTEFDNIWEELMIRVIKEVSSSSYYAAATQNLGSISNMYSFVQCSKDLSLTNCTECLQQSVDEYRSCCRGLQGGIIGRTSCFMRWDLYPFLGLFDDMISPTSSPAKDGRKISTGAMVAIVVASIFVISVLFLLGFSFYLRRKGYKGFVIENGYFSGTKKAKQTYGATPRDDAGDDITTLSSLQLDFEAIEAATSSFERTNKLGQGGFGEVYKGTFPNGTEVAVKRLSKSSGQGEQEFKNEVLLVAKLQHRNLVRLLGFSVQGDEKILVYEFVPNRSLDYFLFDPAKKGQLDWTRRYKIINGIIRGILYLHQDSRLTIIHRDLKASNILLDADMNPKIADFGMARIVGMDQTETNTGRVVGTFGYMPPEYVVKGQFSMKSDVYSFGVLILEIIGGKRSSTFDQMDGSIGNLVTYVWMLWNNKSLLEMVDSEIGENYDRDEVIRCIHIGLLCVQENPADRPTMATIFQMFTNVYISLPIPKPPGFVLTVRSELNPSGKGLQSGQSGSKCSYYSVDNASITTVTPR